MKIEYVPEAHCDSCDDTGEIYGLNGDNYCLACWRIVAVFLSGERKTVVEEFLLGY
jgi:hypothetical protein